MKLIRGMIPVNLVYLFIYLKACFTALRRKLENTDKNEIFVYIGMNNGIIVMWKNFIEITEY